MARSSHRSSHADRQYEFRTKGIDFPLVPGVYHTRGHRWIRFLLPVKGGLERRLQRTRLIRRLIRTLTVRTYATIKSITAYQDRPTLPRVYETVTFIEPRRVIRDPSPHSSGLRRLPFPEFDLGKFEIRNTNVSRAMHRTNFANF